MGAQAVKASKARISRAEHPVNSDFSVMERCLSNLLSQYEQISTELDRLQYTFDADASNRMKDADQECVRKYLLQKGLIRSRLPGLPGIVRSLEIAQPSNPANG